MVMFRSLSAEGGREREREEVLQIRFRFVVTGYVISNYVLWI